jgi:uncharacterized membrane protein
MTDIASPRVLLYGKPGCHLCEQAEAELARMRRRVAHTLQLVDITEDAELMQRYALRIPVLVLGGREYDAPLDWGEIEPALHQAGAAAVGSEAPHAAATGDAPRETIQTGPTPPPPRPPDELQPRPIQLITDEPPSRNPFRHWLATLNTAIGAFLLGALAAPVFAALGLRTTADWLYAAYHFTCHQWAFRSFFLFGTAGPLPITIYPEDQLAATTGDPFGFIGNTDLGWKMAFCERDLAIYVGLLVVGLLYARHRHLQPISFGLYALLILPMAIDGFTQLFGWRESTWELRVATGLLFGLASAWLVLPRLDASFGLQPAARQYAPSAPCDPPQPVGEPWTKRGSIHLSSRG